MIRVNEEDQLQLLVELKRLREQNTELQERGTRYELENRDLREIVRRLSEFPPLSAHAQYRLAQFDEGPSRSS
jgi:regulator of replication initiation timing